MAEHERFRRAMERPAPPARRPLPPSEDDGPVRLMSPRLTRQLLAGGFLVVLVVVAAMLPVPYVALSPGPVYDTLGEVHGEPLIVMTGGPTYPTEGQLDLTTVSENGGPGRPISLLETMAGWVRPSVAVLPVDLLYPPDTSTRTRSASRTPPTCSRARTAATVAALRQAGIAADRRLPWSQRCRPTGRPSRSPRGGRRRSSRSTAPRSRPRGAPGCRCRSMKPGDDVRLRHRAGRRRSEVVR